ncbi:hypothetical protein UNDKW_0788 [Undibacterium sp. KW1]|nr:hypothetical protein UNDKW_0788 [Undibacterium sp. KW1]
MNAYVTTWGVHMNDLSYGDSRFCKGFELGWNADVTTSCQDIRHIKYLFYPGSIRFYPNAIRIT